MSRTALASVLVTALAGTSAVAAPRHSQPVRTQAGTAGTACQDTPKLGYSNGPLIQHVKVVDVFYSPGFKYKAMLESYYAAITQSAYFDWLTEYNAPNGSFKISRGSFLLSFEDTNANPTTVKTVNPETYLKGLLAANKLPKPDDDTIYMMYFPSGVDPTDGSGPSCINNGNYCAYHASYTDAGGQLVRYGVMPDMEAGSCAMGCGPPGFDSFTDVSSHELIEAVTDPDNGTGWYDVGVGANDPNNCGEIGDICATGGTGETGTVNGYVVQKEWSNKNNGCIVTDPNAVVNDFSIAVAPSPVMVPSGGSATATVTLTKKTGMAENVTLSASTVPTGLQAAFSPASVTSGGGTSMVTITAAENLSAGTMLTVTIKGTGSQVSPTVDVPVQIAAPPDMAMAPDLAQGGGGGNGGGGNGGGGNGGNGNHNGGCSMSGAGVGGAWVLGLVLLALAARLAPLPRRRRY